MSTTASRVEDNLRQEHQDLNNAQLELIKNIHLYEYTMRNPHSLSQPDNKKEDE